MTAQKANEDFAKYAIALQWVAADLAPEYIEQTEIQRGQQTAQLGRTWVTNFLLPLTVEFALKGLAGKHGGARQGIHDLLSLYEALPKHVQEKVSEGYRTLANDKGIADDDLARFLEAHRNDFVRWRYLEGTVGDLTAQPLEFQVAISAILDEVFGDV